MDDNSLKNPDVLAYLNRFIRCNEMTIEQATRLKVVQEVCDEIEKKSKK